VSTSAISPQRPIVVIVSRVIVSTIVDDSLSRHLLGDSIDVFVRREDAERFIEEVRGDDPELAKPLRIEERHLGGGQRELAPRGSRRVDGLHWNGHGILTRSSDASA
jgi:hypothetical protein